MIGIIVFILILSFLVLIHELGHFFAARWAGVEVLEFGLGYPPKAIKLFTWKGTDFTLNFIPFGGFVRLAGEDMRPEEKTEIVKKGGLKGQFFQATTFRKLVIILAGATVNFVFGVLAFSVIFSSMGIPEPIETARIGAILPDSPAAEAGMPEQVEITKIQVGEEVFEISTTDDAIDVISDHQGETAVITTTGVCDGRVCEGENQYDVYFRTDAEIPDGHGSLGVAFNPIVFTHYPWWQMPFKSAWYGIQQALFLGKEILFALGQLGRNLGAGQMPQDLAGPVGIVHQAQSAGILSDGWTTLLSFAAMLSINLAIMNVLPIPPLDGGRAVIILFEKLVDKNKLAKIEYYLNYGGYVLLLGLILFVTIQDVVKIIK